MKLHIGVRDWLLTQEDGYIPYFDRIIHKTLTTFSDENLKAIEFCREEICSTCFEKVATHGFCGKKMKCEEHKSEGMTMNFHHMCTAPKCEDIAFIGDFAIGPTLCATHFRRQTKDKPFVKFCLVEGCTTWACIFNRVSFTFLCSEHAQMTKGFGIKSRVCRYGVCVNPPTRRREFCPEHAKMMRKEFQFNFNPY